jgi:RHS repeat-associated protein
LTAIVIKRANDSIVATIEYQYNDQGYRTQKVITEGTSIYTYEYELQGSCVIRETLTKTVNGLRTESYELIFLYDVNNTHIGFLLDGIEYFYLTDLLGNIISILAEDGTEMVKYEYDAYGNIINSTTGILSDINPYTYRGYRYDSETGLYYLNSRYYNPQSGFFISSDGLLGEYGDILSTNMYTYCVNDPINNTDQSGYLSFGRNNWNSVKAIGMAIEVLILLIPMISSFFKYAKLYYLLNALGKKALKKFACEALKLLVKTLLLNAAREIIQTLVTGITLVIFNTLSDGIGLTLAKIIDKMDGKIDGYLFA